MKRPQDIGKLLPICETLATYGAVRPLGMQDDWLRMTGVVVEDREKSLLRATEWWLKDSAPAANGTDMLRKTALRDPFYRQHLDLTIASMLHTVGRTARWARFEELLLGQFKAFSPRFAQLLVWLTLRCGQNATQLTESAWLSTTTKEANQNRNIFKNWDEVLWGTSENSTALFLLLGDLYIPLMNIPTFFCFKDRNKIDPKQVLLERLIDAARHGDGILIGDDARDDVMGLAEAGVPVRLWSTTSSQWKAALVGMVELFTDNQLTSLCGETTTVPVGLPDAALKSAIVTSEEVHQGIDQLWQVIEKRQKASVFYSLDLSQIQWPEEQIKEMNEVLTVPSKSVLRDVGMPRKASPQADAALQKVGDHPLYGFLLQIFLLEALDRELGDETLILVPGTEQGDGNVCDEVTTRVVYRPRKVVDDMNVRRFPAYDLGQIDSVFEELGKSLGIYRIAHPFTLKTCGNWSMAFKLLQDAGIICGNTNRWTLAVHILDRLYGGGLMTSIIRRGRELRERLHDGLKEMWAERDRLQRMQEVQGE